jgi:uncharacterized SAM-binding protein YcdF (DUF218 family)
LLAAGLVLLSLCLLAFALRVPILTGLGNYLVVADELHPADVIFLLNGDFNTRPFHAAELYARGLAPRIVIARVEPSPAEMLGLIPNETDISVRILQRLGVPAEAISVLPVPGGVTSTHDEAAVLHDYVAENGTERVILVTSAFHTRRAGWIFAQALEGLDVTLEVAAAPNPDYGATNWWQSEAGLIAVNNEYVKLLYYLVKYR